MKNIIFFGMAVSLAAGASAATKLIGTGWDLGPAQTPAVILSKADEFAKTGLDGVSVVLSESFNESFMAPKDFTREQAEKYLPDLKKFKDKPGLSESFVITAWSPIPSAAPRMRYDDDAAWARFAANMRTCAWLVKEAGLPGLIIDNEDYLSKRQFFQTPEDPPWEKTLVLARQRGREVGRAMFDVYPQIKLLFYFLMAFEEGLDPVALAKSKKSLWPAFLDGMLDVMPDGAEFICGDEPGYHYMAERRDFEDSVAKRLVRLVRLFAPENRIKFRQHVRMSFGQYLDMYINDNSNPHYYMPPLNGSRLERFRRNLTAAVENSDGYVWSYGEKREWVDWPPCRRAAFMEKAMKKETWDQALPGLSDMLREVKSGDRVAALRHTLDAFRRSGATNEIADVLAKHRGCQWKDEKSAAEFVYEEGKGRNGSLLMKLTGKGSGCFILPATKKVTPGDEYCAEVYVRGPYTGIQLCWQKNGAWNWHVGYPAAVVGEPDAQGWRRAVMRATVPEEINGIVLKMDAIAGEGQTPEFDGAVIYSMAPAERK